MGTAWDVHRCAGPESMCSPFSRVSCVCVCVCIPRWIWRMLGCYRQQRAPWSFWRTKATEPPPLLPSFLLSLKYSRRGFGETFSKKFASKNCLSSHCNPFLSLEFVSAKISKFSLSVFEIQKKRKLSFHSIKPGLLLVNFVLLLPPRYVRERKILFHLLNDWNRERIKV